MNRTLKKLGTACKRISESQPEKDISSKASSKASSMPFRVKQARRTTTRPSISAPYTRPSSGQPKQDRHSPNLPTVVSQEKRIPLSDSSVADATRTEPRTGCTARGIKRKPVPDITEIAKNDFDFSTVLRAGEVAQARRSGNKRARINADDDTPSPVIVIPISKHSSSQPTVTKLQKPRQESLFVTTGPGKRRSKRLSLQATS